jgi:hypothetical protein
MDGPAPRHTDDQPLLALCKERMRHAFAGLASANDWLVREAGTGQTENQDGDCHVNHSAVNSQ